MSDEKMFGAGRAHEIVTLHFDVPGHYLSLATFIECTRSVYEVSEALNDLLFEGTSSCEVVVFPSEEGGLLTRVGIVVGIITGVITIANLEPAASMIERLTGKTLGELGVATIEALLVDEEEVEDPSKSTSETTTGAKPDEDGERKERPTEVTAETAAIIVATATRCVIEVSREKIESIGRDNEDFLDVADARANFYKACLQDPAVKGIGFTPEHEFPVPRGSFAERAVKPPRRKEEEDDPWQVSIEEIYVTSPNWDRSDSHRGWKGRDSLKRLCYFVISDEEFWRRVESREISPSIGDRVVAQWAFKQTGQRTTHRKALRVLSFNEKFLSDPINDNALRARLGSYKDSATLPKNQDLFG